jgi:SM-20-related protein
MTNTLISPEFTQNLLPSLSDPGCLIADSFFPEELCRGLWQDLENLRQKEALQKAGIGRGQQRQINEQIRGDFIHWLDTKEASPSQARFFSFLNELIAVLNREFFLGLNHFESHYALYPAGGGYDRHMDQHAGTRARKVTFILYLNPDWQNSDGGELILYQPHSEREIWQKVEPRWNRLVLFRSEVFPHQVAPCLRPRMSLTGWLRTSH